MSAYVMNDDEFNIMMSYFVKPIQGIDDGAYLKFSNGGYEYLTMQNVAEVAKVLQAQNVASVNERYGEDEKSTYTFEYIPEAHKRPMGNIIGALDCYEYQASEASDWENTLAFDIINRLRKHLLKQLAEDDGTYTWGIK